MKYCKCFVLLSLLFLSCSCNRYKDLKNDHLSVLRIDYPRLYVEDKNDERMYQNIHKEINSLFKNYIQGKESDMCKHVDQIFNMLALKLYSVPRERESERLRLFLSLYCSDKYPEKNYFYNLSDSEYRYLNKKLPGSAAFYDSHDPRRFEVDPYDLRDYVYGFTLEDEYCKKAIQLGQWDHIFYLSDVQSGFPQFMACINKKTQAACRCPAATIMVAKILPKSYFYDTGWLNPSADPMDVRCALKDLTKALKAATGRDLDKEPPVPEFEELFKQKPSSTSINSE